MATNVLITLISSGASGFALYAAATLQYDVSFHSLFMSRSALNIIPGERGAEVNAYHKRVGLRSMSLEVLC